jgi:SAM-dependent methyltransferase
MKEITATKKFYDTHGDHWVNNKTNSFYNEKPFTKLVSLWPARGHILDIGCAHGIHVPMFLGIGQTLRYHGIDISRYFIKIAQRRYPQLPFSYADIADARTLPKKKFDGFFAGSTLQHIPFPMWDTMFENIERTMKKGAYGFLSLPTEHPTGTPKDEDTRHFTILNEVEQRAYLINRGWKIKMNGSTDGFTTPGIWRYYIVHLP